MKLLYNLIFIVFCTHLAMAVNEVPNPSFETWASGNPGSWFSSNIPGYGTPITQSVIAHSGTYAVKGQAVYSATLADTIPPALYSVGPGSYFPISESYSTLEFYYQTNLGGGDIFSIVVAFYDAGNTPVASGDLDITTNTGTWTHVSIPITYFGSSTASKAVITFGMTTSGADGRNSPLLTSTFLLDDVSLTGLAGLYETSASAILQAYPQPAHQLLNIKSSLTGSNPTHLLLTDALGRTVIAKTLAANEFMDYELNLQGLRPGYYSLVMISDEKKLMRRVIIN